MGSDPFDFFRTVFGLLLALVSLQALAQDDMPAHQHHDAMDMGMKNQAADTRIALDLPPAAREGLLQTMREHLEAVQGIVAALAAQDYEQASTIAREQLGFAKHHQVMQRERGFDFPPRYTEFALAHHQAADELADAILKRDMPAILRSLDRTISPCTSCHQEFRL